jgi:hypothetical protein
MRGESVRMGNRGVLLHPRHFAGKRHITGKRRSGTLHFVKITDIGICFSSTDKTSL